MSVVARVRRSSQDSGASLKLHVRTFDLAMRRRDIEGVEAQAAALNMHRSTLFRLRSGGRPSMATALKMAQFCRLPIERLFPPEATS